MKKLLLFLQKINILRILKLEGVASTTIFVILFGIWIALNLIISPFGMRLDLSKGKAYTLSLSTKKILHNLNDVVNIKFYVSTDIPTRLIPLKTETIDLLNEYAKEGGRKIALKIIDPKKDEKALNETKELGIPELPFQQLEKDKYAVSNTYFGIAIGYLDKKEAIPQATDIDSLEYNITSLMYKLTRKEQITIGIMGYSQQYNQQQDPLYNVKQVLSQQFTIEYIDVSSASASKKINPSVKTLMIFDTSEKKYDDGEITQIRGYLEGGGKVIVFANGIWVKDDLTTTPAEHNLFGLLENYGIRLEKNLVLSSTSELVNFGNQEMQFFAPYPFWLKSNVFNTKTSYISNINQLTYPWTSSLSLTKKNNVELQEIVKTTQKSWEQKDQIVLDPQNIPPPSQKDLKEFVIAADAKTKKGGVLVVIPSSRFIVDRYLGNRADNVEFAINALNNLASDGALSGIRSRSVAFYPLPEISDNLKDIFKYGVTLLFPLLFAVYGGIRLLRRK